VLFDYNFDDDPFDREAKFPADSSVSSFNMWQWAGSPHQAWTANMDAFELDVENDVDIHDRASFTLVLTPVPVGTDEVDPTQGPDTAYNDCQLRFEGEQLREATDASGHVVASPVNAKFVSVNDERCEHLEQAWTKADSEEDKRDVLRQVRINQLNFRGWNHGDEPVVIDNVQLSGASTAAEGAIGR
jgi:hypothetical protein